MWANVTPAATCWHVSRAGAPEGAPPRLSALGSPRAEAGGRVLNNFTLGKYIGGCHCQRITYMLGKLYLYFIRIVPPHKKGSQNMDNFSQKTLTIFTFIFFKVSTFTILNNSRLHHITHSKTVRSFILCLTEIFKFQTIFFFMAKKYLTEQFEHVNL